MGTVDRNRDRRERDALYRNVFRSLYRIRRAEEEIARIYPTDKIKSPVHLSIGQEAIAVGVCAALLPEDIVFGTYRGHALYLAKGGDLDKMIAELYGKRTGCAKGKGGSMHLVDVSVGMMGTSAVVGTTIPNAVGYALGLKYQGKKALVVSFLGDGAVEEGVFTESLNFAVLKSLPIIFVCENNGYAIHTKQQVRQAIADIVEQVRPYGLPVERVENNDVLQIYDTVSRIAPEVRAHRTGPVFIECATYRWREHVGPNEDYQFGYRSKSEAEPWIKDDQIKRLADLVGTDSRQELEQEVETEIQNAFEFAEASPFPDAPDLFADVFKGP